MGGHIGFEEVEQRIHALATVSQHLAHQQVDGLDLVGALVNHRHAGVAQDLFDAPFADIAVTTKHLQTIAAAMKSLVREHSFHDGGDQSAPTLRKSLCFGGAVLDLVQLDSGLVGQNATSVDPGSLGVQNAAHGGVLGNQVRFTRAFALAGCTHLATLLRIRIGFLPSRVQQANALQGHMQTSSVHHDEHRIQAFAGLAHDLAGRFVKAHDAGGAAMQAHFFFDALTVHRAACAIGVELGYQEQRQPLGAGRRIGQAREHQVHDVVGQVVLATGDEDFGA